MADMQYLLEVSDNNIVKEEGSFFYAAPFDVYIADKQFIITFERAEDGHVARRVCLGSTVIVDLKHPDYTPDCLVSDLNSHLDLPEAQSLFAAFAKVGIIFEKDYLKFFDESTLALDYKVSQALFI